MVKANKKKLKAVSKKKLVKKPTKVLAKKKIKAKKPAKKIAAKKIVVKKKQSRRVISAKAEIQKSSKNSGFPIKLGMTKKAKKKVVKKLAKKPDKSASRNLTGEFPAESLFKARIKVIGIGGGGGSIVSEIGRSLEKATFMVADTDVRALKKRPGVKYFLFGQEHTHGLGTGVNIELAKIAAESAKEKISSNFKDQDIIIFIASLGGGLGSGATQVFADAAREFGGITFGIFTTPFKFEGKNKQRIALNALKTLRESLNVSLVIPNEKIFKIIGANTPITQAFSIVNKSLIESLESLIDLIYNPGVINIDFADLRAILRGRGNSAFLNTVEESGKDRAEKICKSVLANPLLQSSSLSADKILFNIAGAENLSMFEVEKISSHIANTNPKSKIIFGISKNPKLKNKIKTTILMTGGALKDDFVEEAEKEEVVAVKEIPEKKVTEQKVKKPVKPAKKTSKKTPSGNKQAKKPEKKEEPEVVEQKPVSFIPVFEAPVPMEIVQLPTESAKKNIRRSGLEIKKAEELQEKKKIAQEKEWEIPAFLRRVKYK